MIKLHQALQLCTHLFLWVNFVNFFLNHASKCSVSLGEVAHSALLDEVLGSYHMLSQVRGQIFSFLFVQNLESVKTKRDLQCTLLRQEAQEEFSVWMSLCYLIGGNLVSLQWTAKLPMYTPVFIKNIQYRWVKETTHNRET